MSKQERLNYCAEALFHADVMEGVSTFFRKSKKRILIKQARQLRQAAWAEINQIDPIPPEIAALTDDELEKELLEDIA